VHGILQTVLSDERVLWRTGTRHNELALHTAIRSRNYGVATSLLHRMEDSNASYDAFCRIHRPSKAEDNEDDDDDDETSVAVRVPLLQFALMHHTSSRFLVDLLELFPQAAKTAGQDRKLPLITALEHCYPVRKIDAIVEAYPAALQVATGDGDLPLHLAASYYEGADALAVLQHLLERNDAALTVANCHGQWPLHCAMENQGLPLTLELLQLLAGGPQPLSLSHVTTRMDKYQHVNEYTFPALQQADSYDELPLHICCRRLDSRLALEWLLEHSPRDAIRRSNRHGHLPLHLAAAASDIDDVTDATRMFHQIIQAYPEALYAPDSDGDLPLHCAVLLPHSLLDLLYVPDACNKMDGNWPLHIAARHGVDEKVLAALIRMHPHSVLGFNGDGQLPFHVAAEHELGIVRLLQPQERPPAVMDGTPALIAAAEASADISTLLHLALLSPDLFCQRRRLPRPRLPQPRQQPVMAPQ
jgi:ankyrin repeat protein